jgi:hypothetical protein
LIHRSFDRPITLNQEHNVNPRPTTSNRRRWALVTVFVALAGSAAAFAQPAQALTATESKCAALAPAGVTARFVETWLTAVGLSTSPSVTVMPSILAGSTVRTGTLIDVSQQVLLNGSTAVAIAPNTPVIFTPAAGLSGFEGILYTDVATNTVVGVDCFVIGESVNISGSFTVTPQPGPCITLTTTNIVSFGSVTAGATTQTPGSVTTPVANCAPFAETLVANVPALTFPSSTILYSPASGSLSATQFEWGVTVTGSSRVALSTTLTQIGSLPVTAGVAPSPVSMSHDFRVGAGWVDTSAISYVTMYITAIA